MHDLSENSEIGKPGRFCPLDYRLTEEDFSGEPLLETDSLYVAGGVYGNPFALKLILELAEKEGAKVILNGDIHWFDLDIKAFSAIEEMVEKKGTAYPLLGNVEAELCRETDLGAGCGCAYPSCVSAEAVERSNEMHAMMKAMLSACLELTKNISKRKKTAVVLVGGKRVAVTHGDEKSLGGWECGYDALLEEERQRELSDWLLKHGFSVLACTHTCCAVAIKLPHGVVINNGSSGLSNFEDSSFGLITRIAKTPANTALYRTVYDGLYIEAVPVYYDNEAYLEYFDRIWKKGSPAEISYRERIVSGLSDMKPEDANLGGFDFPER